MSNNNSDDVKSPKQPIQLYPRLSENLQSRLNDIVVIAAVETGSPIAIITEKTLDGLLVRAAYDDPANPFKPDDIIPYDSNLFCLKVVSNAEPLHIDESDGKPSHYLSTPILTPSKKVFGALSVKESTLRHGLEACEKVLGRLRTLIENDLAAFHR